MCNLLKLTKIGIKIKSQLNKENPRHYGCCFNLLLIQSKSLLTITEKKEKKKEAAKKRLIGDASHKDEEQIHLRTNYENLLPQLRQR